MSQYIYNGNPKFKVGDKFRHIHPENGGGVIVNVVTEDPKLRYNHYYVVKWDGYAGVREHPIYICDSPDGWVLVRTRPGFVERNTNIKRDKNGI